MRSLEVTASTVFTSAVILTLSTYVFVDGTFVYLSSAQLGLYALIIVTACSAALRTAVRFPVSRVGVVFVAAWISMLVVWLVPSVLGQYWYPVYVAGDLVGLALPALLLLAGFGDPRLFTSYTVVGLFAGAMAVAAILAVPAAEVISRHEPPAIFLTATAWAYFFSAHSPVHRRLAMVVLVLVLTLSWTSSERTAVLMWVALGIVGRAFLVKRARNLAIGAVVGVLGLSAAVALAAGEIVAYLATTRLEALSQGELDVSLLNRFLEAADGWRQWSMSAAWLGFGHGATYVPELSYPFRNLTADGRVHHFHIGPVLLLYRYGVIGLLLLAWLAVDVLRYVTRLNKIRFEHPHRFMMLLFPLALTGYLASFLMFNVLPDPAFSYSLAGYLYIRLTLSLPIKSKFVSP